MLTLIIYPIVGHWVWGGGWLANLGFMDFAGDTVVHSVGGWAALAGALILGPRIGKYGKDGKVKAIPGHNMSLAVIGLFVLWLGWFGFNPGSTMSFQNPADVMHILMTTNTAAIAAIITSTAVSWIVIGKPDLGMTINGCLAGLVGVTGSCAYVTIEGSLLIGAIAGLDIGEHGNIAYPDFALAAIGTEYVSSVENINIDITEDLTNSNNVIVDSAIPVVNKAYSGEKMTKVSIITNQNKLSQLQDALEKLGVTGLTVTNVLGHVMQKGNPTFFRGAPMDTRLLPKVKIDVVICKIPTKTIVETIQKVLYTGKIGDGKIFIYDVEDVIKIRTKEHGYDALQDEE